MLTKVITLDRTLQKRAVAVLAYFRSPRAGNGPAEAVNGRLEHLGGSALVPQPDQLHHQEPAQAGGSDRDYTLVCEEPKQE